MKKYLSNKFVKIWCLNSLASVLNKKLDDKKSNKLIVITANGIYSGTLKNYDDSDGFEVKDTDDIMTIYHKSYLEALNDAEKDVDKDTVTVNENPISITLENVEIRSTNNGIIKTNLPFVEIFIDQIIGISFGSFASDNQQN